MTVRVSRLSLATASFAMGLGLVSGLASAQQAVGPNADVKDRNLVLPKNSQLRTGPSLFSRPVAVAPANVTVRGTGKCDEGACPVSYDGKSLWARRSRLTFGTAEQAAATPPAGASTPAATAPGAAAPAAKPSVVERVKAAVTGKKPATAQPARTRLERGNKGEDVARLQEALKKAGVFSGDVDGNFGRATKAAVEDYQKKNGLTADGVAGRATFAKLGL